MIFVNGIPLSSSRRHMKIRGFQVQLNMIENISFYFGIAAIGGPSRYFIKMITDSLTLKRARTIN